MALACGLQVHAAAVATKPDWAGMAAEMDTKSPLEIMDHVRGLAERLS
jgi:hypothetical protein